MPFAQSSPSAHSLSAICLELPLSLPELADESLSTLADPADPHFRIQLPVGVELVKKPRCDTDKSGDIVYIRHIGIFSSI